MAHFASREGGRWRGRWVDPGLGRGMSVLESLILYSIPGKQRKMSTPRAKRLENTKRKKKIGTYWSPSKMADCIVLCFFGRITQQDVGHRIVVVLTIR